MESKKAKKAKTEKKSTIGVTKTERDINDKEFEIIKKWRELNNVEITGVTRQLFLESDQVVFQLNELKYNVRQRLNMVKELYLNILRKEVQLRSGIYETLERYPDKKKTKDEIQHDIDSLKIEVDKTVSGIKSSLGIMVKYVNQLRMDKKIILTQEEYEEYAKDIDSQLKSLTGKGIIL